MSILSSYFEIAIKQNASDLHLLPGQKPVFRVHGELNSDGEIIDEKELESEIFKILNDKQRKIYEEQKDLDLGYSYNGNRFRLNIHQQEGKIALSARLIPETIPGPAELGFEPIMGQFASLMDGLVLIVGPTGHGKSTTIASLINEINHHRRAHIITVEDPVEFIFEEDQSLIEQREIGSDTVSFASALKHVLRQDPDIIFIGEMRDPETIATALTAAETGHLVFSTLHTSSAAEAIERIVDVFEGSKQKQILIQLSSVLRGVVAQHLLPKVGGGLVAAREILINTPAVANLIRENNISQIQSTMQTGKSLGMITMESAVEKLIKDGLLAEDTYSGNVLMGKK